MGKSSEYGHYMKRADITDSYIDIEEYSNFKGLRYMKVEGIMDVGKAKNIYTETYADSDTLRVYLPKHYSSGTMVHSVDDIANEATQITMYFLVIGYETQRLNTIKNFRDYLRAGIHTYYDDARLLEFDFIVTDEFKVSEERWHGSQPYAELVVTMQNLNGKTRPH